MPSQQAPVEDYKLSDGMKSWMDKFARAKKLQGMFQRSLQKEKQIMGGMQQKYQQFMQFMNGLVQQMPTLKTKETEGQDTQPPRQPKPGEMDFNAVGQAMQRKGQIEGL